MSRPSTVIYPFVPRSIYVPAITILLTLALLILALTGERLVKADLNINISTVSVGSSPVRAAVNLFTNKIYVANNLSGNITVIDGDTDTTVTVAAGTLPNDVEVNPLTNKIYVANSGSASVTVIDGSDNSTITIPVGLWPGAIAINPLTNKIYVANEISHDITIINGADNSTSTVFVGVDLAKIEIDLITNKLYFISPAAHFVGIMDVRTNSFSNVPAVLFPGDMAINPVTNKLYITDIDASRVVSFDATHGSTETVPAGLFPRTLTINSITNKIYVANVSDNFVTVIDGNDNSTSSIETLFNPWFVAVDPATNKVYIGSRSDGRILIVDAASNKAVRLFTDFTPFNAVINPITNKVYVVNLSSNVTVIDPSPKVTSLIDTAITSLPGNITGNPSPEFTLTATSNLPDAPSPQNIYFQMDTTTGAWTKAQTLGQTGATLTATAVTQPLSQGMHIIYCFASGEGEGSPVTGGISAYPFYVILNPTAAEVSVSGRVLTPGGNPLRNAWVELLDLHGPSRTTLSSSLGYYRFEGVGTGKSYVISASAKRYRFDSQLVTINSELTSLDFTARAGTDR